MREIIPGVLTWSKLSDRFGYDFNGFLVRDVAIDPVEMDDETLERLAKERVERIVLTNRNHYRDVEKLRKRTGAKVAVHTADAAWVRGKGVTVDETLVAGEKVGPFVVLAAAGKSPGEVALHWPARKLLIVGDACVGPKPGELGLLPAAAIDDLPALKKSLEQLLTVDFDALLLADGHSILTGGKAALAKLVATFHA